MVQPLIIFRRGIFVYRHWGCKSIYRPLSYPFRSLLLYHLNEHTKYSSLNFAILLFINSDLRIFYHSGSKWRRFLADEWKFPPKKELLHFLPTNIWKNPWIDFLGTIWTCSFCDNFRLLKIIFQLIYFLML